MAPSTLPTSSVLLLLAILLAAATAIDFAHENQFRGQEVPMKRNRRAGDSPGGTVDTGSGNVQTVNTTFQYYTTSIRASPLPGDGWQARTSDWLSVDGDKRTYFTLGMPFPLRFYGAEYRDVYVATGGFVSVVPDTANVTVQSWYIAPLMADFTSPAGAKNVFYYLTPTFVVIQWEGLTLATNQTHSGQFDFQAIIRSSGVFTFFYRSLPIPIANILQVNLGDGLHPVRVGVADAYQRAYMINGHLSIIDYHYSEISPPLGSITVNSTVTMTPLPTCNTYLDCQSCTQQTTTFDCHWCSTAAICSDGIDRNRNSYILNNCENTANEITATNSCPASSDKVLHELSFAWPYSSFNCWQTVAYRIGVTEADIKSPSTVTTGANSVKVVFNVMSTNAEAEDYKYFLQSSALMSCNGQSASLSQVTAAVYTESSDSVSSAAYIAIGVGAAIVVLSLSIIVWLVYAYRNPGSRSGRWLIAHRHMGCCKKDASREQNYDMGPGQLL